MLRVRILVVAAAALAGPGLADPLGLVDYDALLVARPGTSFCTGATLCTVVMPGGGVVQQDGEGRWLAGGDDLSAGGFALGYALTEALFDRCGAYPDGIAPEVLARATDAMLVAYRLGLGIDGTGQTAPDAATVSQAYQALQSRLGTYLDSDPDLSRCQLPNALAGLLVELAQEAYFQPELTRLTETPALPTANFRITD